MKKQAFALGLSLAGILFACLIDVACPQFVEWRDGGMSGVVVARPHAQTSIVGTLDFGRFYNYAEGTWTFGQVPGVEVSRGCFSILGSVSVDRSGVFSRDLFASWSLERGRVTFGAAGGASFYPGLGRDLTASGSLRVRIK